MLCNGRARSMAVITGVSIALESRRARERDIIAVIRGLRVQQWLLLAYGRLSCPTQMPSAQIDVGTSLGARYAGEFTGERDEIEKLKIEKIRRDARRGTCEKSPVP